MESLAADTAAETFGTNVGEQIAARMETLGERRNRARRRPLERVTADLPCNVGAGERTFRFVAGGALLAAAAFAPVGRGWRFGLMGLGAMEVITGALRYCPISHALGINTCRADER
jgi:hypothetical protein